MEFFGALVQSIRQQWAERRKSLKIHRERCRQVYGCLACGVELYPGDTFYLCGYCGDGFAESFSWCPKCYGSRTHHHRMYREIVPLEVDPISIVTAGSASEALMAALKLYGPRLCLGHRSLLPDGSGFEPEYTWLTYSDVLKTIKTLASGFQVLGLNAREFVILWGASSVQWFLAHYACLGTGIPVISVHSSISVHHLTHIIKLARPSLVVASRHLRGPLGECLAMQNHSVRIVVLFDDLSSSYALRQDLSLTKDINVNVINWNELLALGRQPNYNIPPPVPTDIVMLLPTSGTTGPPKLTIVTDAMLRRSARTSEYGDLLVMIAFEPLRQSLDIFCLGGRIGVFSGSLDILSEDIEALRPTVFGATPTFWNGLHQNFINELAREYAVNPDDPPTDIYARVRAEWRTRKVLGNRCRIVFIGGARSSKAIRDWIFNVLGCIVVDGYGTTETGGLASGTKISAKLHLIDAPEVGYLTTDRPHPRGEILAHTARTSPGYYGDPVATSSQFVEIAGERFFKTGDIGEMVDGAICVIDRRSAMFKLAQGIFVAPEPLEEMYGASDLVEQVFVWGESPMACVVAVVVPSQLLLLRVQQQVGEEQLNEDLVLLCTTSPHRNLAEQILERDLRRLGREATLPMREIPQMIYLEHEAFTPWNGLLSSIGKHYRPALVKKYRPHFTALLETTQLVEEIPLITNQDSEDHESGICRGLRQLLAETLPSIPPHLVASDSLADIGVDSMALARLVTAIRKHFGVSIPLPILCKLPSLLHLEKVIFGDAITTSIVDWWAEVDNFWDPIHSLTISRLPMVNNSSTGNGILLTGATGFLGAYLLHELLHTPAYIGLPIFCLVRAKSTDDALQRLHDALEHYGLPTKLIVRIHPLAGDLSQPRLGLMDSDYKKLSQSIHIIYHNAAQVNGILPYSSLRPANVIGTQNILQLAFSVPSDTLPFLYHISTIAILGHSGIVTESPQIPPTALPLLTGYAQSKWVAENLVHRAFAAGLRGCVFRPGTISGHSATGKCNPLDSVTLLIRGLAKETVWCDGGPLPRRFLLAPVDYVVKGIVEIATSGMMEGVYHFLGKKPVPLTAIIDALVESGNSMTRVSLDNFKEHVNTIDEIDVKHPLYFFRGALLGDEYSIISEAMEARTRPQDDKTKQLIKRECPAVDVGIFVQGILV